MLVQVPTILLPTSAPSGTETEIIADANRHVSLEPSADSAYSIVRHLYEKTVFIYAQEIVVAGVPGNLQVAIEISPYPSYVTTSFWTQLGAAVNIVGAGVNGQVHTLAVPWNTYSPFIRIVLQTPIPAAAAYWACQAILTGQG